jgi:hypothetical protein
MCSFAKIEKLGPPNSFPTPPLLSGQIENRSVHQGSNRNANGRIRHLPPIWALFLPVVGKPYNRSCGNATACSAEIPRSSRKGASRAISSRSRAKRRVDTSMPPRPRFHRERGVIQFRGDVRKIRRERGGRGSSCSARPFLPPDYSYSCESDAVRLVGKLNPSRVLAGNATFWAALYLRLMTT